MRDLRLSAAHRVKQVRTINALSSCTCISLEYFPAQVDAGRGFPAQVDAGRGFPAQVDAGRGFPAQVDADVHFT